MRKIIPSGLWSITDYTNEELRQYIVAITDPTGGDIRIDNDEGTYELKVRDDGQTIMREADLGQAGAATLSFNYWRKELNGSSDYVAVEVS